MKFFFLLAIFLFCSLKSSAQEQKVPVGSQPVEIIREGNGLHVFCSGFDVNGNGLVEKELGDVEASWWIFDPATINLKRSKVLEGGFLQGSPLNIAMTLYLTYVFQNGKIKEFSTREQEFAQEITPRDSLKNIVAMYRTEDYKNASTSGMIVTTLSLPENSTTGYLSWVDKYYGPNGKVIPVGENPIQVLHRDYEYYILNRGELGKNNCTLQKGLYDTLYTPLGDYGNFMIDQFRNDSLFIVMYGSHEVKIFDTGKSEIAKTIPTQTTGYKGPRECAIDGDNLYVTTYNCDIRKFSISTGELLKIIPVSGMADPIQVVNGKLIVGITRTCDSLPNNTISVIDITSSVSGEEPFAIAASVSPNPFKNSASISATFPPQIHSATIEIFSSTGHSIGVFKKEVINGELNFPIQSDVLQLAQGQYMARISAGKQMSVVPFVVMR